MTRRLGAAAMFARLRKLSRHYHELGHCTKQAHDLGRFTYFHEPEDDRPFTVDGVTYCGRCHCVMPADAAGKGTP